MNPGTDGRPSGTGYVIFGNGSDAHNAVSMFDGAELNGMRLEVREERFAAPTSGAFGRNSDSVDAPRGPASSRVTVQPSKQLCVNNVREILYKGFIMSLSSCSCPTRPAMRT